MSIAEINKMNPILNTIVYGLILLPVCLATYNLTNISLSKKALDLSMVITIAVGAYHIFPLFVTVANQNMEERIEYNYQSSIGVFLLLIVSSLNVTIFRYSRSLKSLEETQQGNTAGTP